MSVGDRADAFEDLDRLVHDPARLAICSILLNCESADFVFLRKVLAFTSGNLSFHLSRLEEGGLIAMTRKIVGRTTRTTVALTPLGRQRVVRHWAALDRLRGRGTSVR
jgi:DNA-binding MarR family transcriptional regulator